MENNKEQVKDIAFELLTTECMYKFIRRSGWMCGFGNGVIAHIEDHRNHLQIRTEHYTDHFDIDKYQLIEDLIQIEGVSSTKIDDFISVKKTENSDEEPADILMELAKKRLCWFGYKITNSEITIEEIEAAIDRYYLNRK